MNFRLMMYISVVATGHYTRCMCTANKAECLLRFSKSSAVHTNAVWLIQFPHCWIGEDSTATVTWLRLWTLYIQLYIQLYIEWLLYMLKDGNLFAQINWCYPVVVILVLVSGCGQET